jgi:hypothetical protein
MRDVNGHRAARHAREIERIAEVAASADLVRIEITRALLRSLRNRQKSLNTLRVLTTGSRFPRKSRFA